MVVTAAHRTQQHVLNGALAVEARSILAYALQVAAGREAVLPDDVRAGLVRLRSELGESANRLADLILAQGGTPDPGNFPLVATNYNFLDVVTLLDRIAPTLPGDVARLEELAAALPEPADVHDLLVGLAAEKRGQQALVAELLGKLRPATAAPAPPEKPATPPAG